MGLIHSNLQGVPGLGCQSPAITSILFVTAANAVSLDASGAGSYNADNKSFIEDKKIRCTSEGVLKKFTQIHQDDGVSLPSANAKNTSTPNIDVKRPNCTCAKLTDLTIKHQQASATPSNVYSITFADGYSIKLGKYIFLLKIGTSGLEFSKVEDLTTNDYIAKCATPGRTDEISAGCVKITSISSNASVDAGEYFVTEPETDWPQSQFPTSEIRCSLMLENGVYIFTIPDGGEYA